jgi:hypothetical protein
MRLTLLTCIALLSTLPVAAEAYWPRDPARETGAYGALPPDPCRSGYVWREAGPRDYVCVTPEARDRTRMENRYADGRRRMGGGDYGRDTCRTGYVWREAFRGDTVCVTPEVRDLVAQENRLGPSRTVHVDYRPDPRDHGGVGRGPSPDTCLPGYVWREARHDDLVCVTPEARDRTASENRRADERRQPGGGAYGPDTCRSGFVWREAYRGDVVCVTPEVRDLVREENRLGPSRRAG